MARPPQAQFNVGGGGMIAAAHPWVDFPYLRYQARVFDHDGHAVVDLEGRLAWALLQLKRAGANGCNTTTHPAPHWPAYVRALEAIAIPITKINIGPFFNSKFTYVLAGEVVLSGGTLGEWLVAELSQQPKEEKSLDVE
jgi:hypothetical protein